ncbi:MAG: CAP domain-containing protein, partial [Thermomicrobiales bacterium]
LLDMINQLRAQNNRGPLTRQTNLDTAARAHSQDMITRCFFDHVNPDGTDPFQRMKNAGYTGVPLAENIYKGSGSLGSAAEAFDAWKNSPGHLTNMLTPDATEIGIGTALDGGTWMNWTNVFGRPR